jgi:retinoid hydroxylase
MFDTKSPYSYPGNFGLFFLGEVLDLYANEQLFYWSHYQKYGENFITQFLGQKTIILSDPRAYQEVLVEKADFFSSNLGWEVLEPFLGRGILLEDGDLHLQIRKVVKPSFHQKAILEYHTIISNVIDRLFVNLALDTPIKLFDLAKQYTLFVISRIVFGNISDQKIVYITQLFEQIIAGLREWLRLPFPFTTYGNAFVAKSELERITLDEFKHKQFTLNDECSDFLSILVLAHNENLLTEKRSIEVVLQLLFGGHETTSNILVWLINMIYTREDVKSRLLEEIKSLDLSDPLFSTKTPYLDSVIAETQRLFPPVFYIPRVAIKDVNICNISIPTGWSVHLCPLITHRMPQIFKNPSVFDPLRFLDRGTENQIKPYTFFGFGLGEHYCVGSELALLEIKSFVINLLARHDIKLSNLVSSTDVTNSNKTVGRLTLQRF